MSEPVVTIFVNYSHQDPEYLRDDSLLGNLKGLENQGNVRFWTDRNLIGSDEWDAANAYPWGADRVSGM